MHSSKKILKTVLILVICVILLKGLDMALYPCTFMRNDVHAVVTEQFDDIILGTSHGKMDIDPEVMEEIYDWEREEVEDIIWDAFFNKNEIELAQFFPKLKKYDGIKALKESPYLLQIPSEASVEIGKILYEATGDEGYLDIIKKNIDASPETISFVSILSYCKPCQRLYNILVDIYINNSNKVNRSTAVMGILYNKGIIKDRGSIKESNDVISLRKKFKSEDSIERQKILEKFENGELTL